MLAATSGGLQRAYDNLNRCPLGSGAITTTGFPIDRHRVAALLGFAAPTVNSYGSIASVDYFTELLGATSAMLVNIGKFAQEFLLMAMIEFDVIRLPDGYVQGLVDHAAKTESGRAGTYSGDWQQGARSMPRRHDQCSQYPVRRYQ
jgi:argininosuccinate lyase